MRLQVSGWREWLLVGLTGGFVVAVIVMPAIPQPLGYHAFADARRLLAIPSALNVISNVPFLLAGTYGLALTARAVPERFADGRERHAYAVFFAGAILTTFGSAWYHAAPDNARLVWDRLPMTLGFAGLTAAVLAERVDRQWGRRALWPLVLVGFASVAYWYVTERTGRGNVVPYAAYQAWTIAVVVFAIVACPARRYSHGAALWWVVALYAAAKCAEGFDAVIFRSGGLVSGHTLKHVLAAGAVLAVAEMLRRRTRLPAFADGSAETTSRGWARGGAR